MATLNDGIKQLWKLSVRIWEIGKSNSLKRLLSDVNEESRMDLGDNREATEWKCVKLMAGEDGSLRILK